MPLFDFPNFYCLSAQQMRYSIILLYRFLFAFILLLGNCTAVSPIAMLFEPHHTRDTANPPELQTVCKHFGAQGC